ncbi:MAG: hypothetical protein MJE77_19330, partial [Proteobacteria bacterium]|nr:hypothetical protein [Pseudomonadota bacterium]
MKQPVSNNSFKPRRGYLGVFLHEGGPITDALWNENSDIQWTMVRWLALDAGLAGTTGDEFKIVEVGDHANRNLLIKGGPGRFYCNGLPILWPYDRLIDSQGECCEPLITHRYGEPVIPAPPHDDSAQSDEVVVKPDHPCAPPDDPYGASWTDDLRPGKYYYVYLDAWVDTVDALDTPFLDDPGICCEPGRGSFRKVVRSCVRLAEVGEYDEPIDYDGIAPTLEYVLPGLDTTNLELTIEGTYQSDRNVFYAVELVSLSDNPGDGKKCAQVLWDDAGGAVVSVVTKAAEQYSYSVELQSTRGFEVGHRVRFDGCGISKTIYRVTGVDGERIKICRDPLGVVPRSLAGCEPVTWEKDPNYPVAYKLTVKAPCKPDGVAIEVGDLVVDVPMTDAHSDCVWWVATSQCCDHYKHTEDELPCCDKSQITFTLVLDGLTDALDPWDKTRAARLMTQAHPFSYCVVVEDRPDWTEGMRVLISARDPGSDAKTTDPKTDQSVSPDLCLPGDDRIRSPEVRTITKIVRTWRKNPCDNGNGDKVPVMIVRLDEPLSYEHTVCLDTLTPARLIRAQRFAGHDYCVHIGSVNRNETSGGPCCLSGALKLPSGLELFLTTPLADDDVEPVVVPGDGWRFAARGSGWVDRRVFAPVDPRYRCRTPLASFYWHEENKFTDLTDLRPVPRGTQREAAAVDSERKADRDTARPGSRTLRSKQEVVHKEVLRDEVSSEEVSTQEEPREEASRQPVSEEEPIESVSEEELIESDSEELESDSDDEELESDSDDEE